MRRSRVVWMVAGSAGLLLIAAQAMGVLLGPGFPALTSPLPYVFVDLLWSEVPVLVVAAAALLVPLLVFACVLRWGQWTRVPLAILYLVVAATSFLWFSEGWVHGLRFEGAVFTWGAAILSGLIGILVGAMFFLNWRRPSQGRLFAVAFLLFFWLYTYAVPYLGETP